MKLENLYVSENCSLLGEVLGRIGDKWTVLVVCMLSNGTMRFNEMRRSLDGISQRMLTLTLRGLERDGLVMRTSYPTIPPRVEYELTELGRTLIEPLVGLIGWARENRGTVIRARQEFDSRCGKAEMEDVTP